MELERDVVEAIRQLNNIGAQLRRYLFEVNINFQIFYGICSKFTRFFEPPKIILRFLQFFSNWQMLAILPGIGFSSRESHFFGIEGFFLLLSRFLDFLETFLIDVLKIFNFSDEGFSEFG